MASKEELEKELADLKNEIKELNTELKDFSVIVDTITKGSQRLVSDLTQSTEKSLSFKKVLDQVIIQSEEIGAQFVNVSDLQKKMITDERII